LTRTLGSQALSLPTGGIRKRKRVREKEELSAKMLKRKNSCCQITQRSTSAVALKSQQRNMIEDTIMIIKYIIRGETGAAMAKRQVSSILFER